MEPPDGIHRQVGACGRGRNPPLLSFLSSATDGLCWGLSQRAPDGPAHVERRGRAEGVHQGQHAPALPTVVLGRRPDPDSESHQQIFDLPPPPKTVFQVSEWAVDVSVPGGTDKEGWQYAADFPAYVSATAPNQQV